MFFQNLYSSLQKAKPIEIKPVNNWFTDLLTEVSEEEFEKEFEKVKNSKTLEAKISLMKKTARLGLAEKLASQMAVGRPPSGAHTQVLNLVVPRLIVLPPTFSATDDFV